MVIIGFIAGLSARDKAAASISTGIELAANALTNAETWAPGDLRTTAICEYGTPSNK